MTLSKKTKEELAEAVAASVVGVGVGVAAFFTGGVGAVAILGAKPLAKWLVAKMMADSEEVAEKKVALLGLYWKEIKALKFSTEEMITEEMLEDPVWLRYHAHRLDVTRKVLVECFTALREKIAAAVDTGGDTEKNKAILDMSLEYHKEHIRALSPSKELAFVASVVPLPPRDYCREVVQVDELTQKVAGSATQPGVQVYNLCGVPGMGKQTLCNHVAQHFIDQCQGEGKDRLFDVVLWASDNLERALADMADMLHIKGREGMSQMGRAEKVAARLRQTPLRWLLVAVNVEEGARHLLPTSVTGDDASGGCVLTTSKGRLDVANCERIAVAEWTEEDKVAAAAHLTGVEVGPETRAVLVSATKGFSPHGVAVAAAHVRERVDLLQCDALSEWKQIADNPNLVDAFSMINALIGELTESNRALLRLLSVLPVDDIPRLPFEGQLLPLAKKSLVAIDTLHAFHIHHSVREAAMRGITAGEKTEALRSVMDAMVAKAPTLKDLEIGMKDKLIAARLLLPHMEHVFATFRSEGGEEMEGLGEWVAYALDRAKSRPTESKEMWETVAGMATEVTKRNLFRARAAHMEMLADKSKATEILQGLGDIGAEVTVDSSADEMRTALQRTFIMRGVKGQEEKVEMLYNIIGEGEHADPITRGRANFNLALVWKGRGEKAEGKEKSQWLGLALEKLAEVVPHWKDNGADTCLSLEGEANVAKLMVLKGKADEAIAERWSDGKRDAKVMVQKGLAVYKDVVNRSEALIGPDDFDTLLTKFFCAKFTGKHGDRKEALEMMKEFRASFSDLFPTHKKLKDADKKIAEWEA